MGVPQGVLDLAVRQGGYITRSQLIENAMKPSTIDWRVRSGQLERTKSGLYRVLRFEDHLSLMKGAVLALPGAVVSHHSAAIVLELPNIPRYLPTVTVPASTTHTFAGVTVRRCDDLEPNHVIVSRSIPVTSVARTLFDLAGVVTPKEFGAIAEGAILQGMVGEEDLADIAARLSRRGKRGSKTVRDFLTTLSGPDISGTPLERKGRLILLRGKLPSPIQEFPIPWKKDRRFDDAYPEATLALEWDSRAWHLQRAAMASDRQRDREAALHGWVVVRFTWDDVTKRPAEVVQTVRTLLRQRTLS